MAARNSRKSKSRKKRTIKKPPRSAIASSNLSELDAGFSDDALPDNSHIESILSRIDENLSSTNYGDCSESNAIRLSQLRRAEDVFFNAPKPQDRYEKIHLAKKVLEISDLCVDAWLLLSGECDDILEAKDLVSRGVMAGENAIKLEFGPDAFTKHAGHFWSMLNTRSYMIALDALSSCLWLIGDKEESIAILKKMLKLNPNDNQGMRTFLVARLFRLNDLSEVESILELYKESRLGAWCWNMALLLFRKEGDSARSTEALDQALKVNSFVPKLLISTTSIQDTRPEYYSPGSAEEASLYVFDNLDNWLDTKGSLFWVRNKAKSYITLHGKTRKRTLRNILEND